MQEKGCFFLPKLKKRADGRYQANIYLGKDADGKPHYKTVYAASQKELNEKATEIRVALGKGIDVTKAQNTFDTWANLLLKHKKDKVSAPEYRTLEYRIRFFSERFGALPIVQITAVTVEGALDQLAATNPTTGRPSSQKTLDAYKQACGQVFRFAIRNRVLAINPVESAECKAAVKSGERRALSPAEIRQIVNLADHRAKLPAMIAVFCGLRRGEIAALLWSDIDLKAGRLTVNKSYSFKQKAVKSPKTDAGTRTLEIPTILLRFLQAQPKKIGYVVTAKSGRPMIYESDWESLMNSLRIALEIQYGSSGRKNWNEKQPAVFTLPRFGWHDCRHAYATMLYNAGVIAKDAQYMLGHADIAMTLDTYTHIERQQHRSADQLNDYVSQIIVSQTA